MSSEREHFKIRTREKLYHKIHSRILKRFRAGYHKLCAPVVTELNAMMGLTKKKITPRVKKFH